MVAPSCGNSTMAGMDLGAVMAPFQHGDDDGGSIGRARSGPDGPRSELGCFFYFQNSIFLSVGNDRYYKLFIFCIVQIVSVAGADTKYSFPTDTINTFCCSDDAFLGAQHPGHQISEEE
jgi:hypothetical protein